ncbi:HEPN domain-containing protein [Geoalkalibacter halelectricus]|uniref:HEPN domain-containing protein n=1 Tax=Geoalkalibacter halelectricus TaxID=2847045 RepID=A0ABY5ZNM9_9BACT|nr:HEPN domain-containing protein [Geoalkalibacter halelectricus]MDO3378344.1 HEPN domain-containing protein [Geoalkalibacter halelectricus]UWZ80336.1 HEPN domain-containing protein [Geoalkalibacter halelectricus]
MNRYQDWLRQAENDLQWARHSFSGGFFAQTCFIAQQAAEKALKSWCFFKGFDIVRSHSIFQIVRALGENGDLERWARELDIYYISARYPDALPAGAPFEILTPEQAQGALRAAEGIFDLVGSRLSGAEQP